MENTGTGHFNPINHWVAVSGTVLEWAEYTCFAYLSVKLSSLFFPTIEAQKGILATFAIMAGGFLLRPLGAYLFGKIGDHFGRKPALLGSMLLMAISSLSLGVLPTPETIGPLAAVGLLICRLLQGIGVGGEFNGAAIYLIEQSPKTQHYFAGSLVGSSAALGMVLGGSIAAFIQQPGFPEWAWRVPFLVGGLFCLVTLWLRHRMTESSLFMKDRSLHKKGEHLPLLQLLKEHSGAFITTALISAMVGIYVYIGNVFYIAFLVQEAKASAHTAACTAMIGELCVAILIPVVGYCADRFRCPISLFRAGLLFAATTTPFYFALSLNTTPFLLGIAQCCFAITNALICGPVFGILFELFPTNFRYRGLSLAWSISAAIFSGTAAFIAQQLNQLDILLPGLYVSIFALLTLFLTNHQLTSKFSLKIS